LWNVSTCSAPALVAYKTTSASSCCQTSSSSQPPTIHTVPSRTAPAPTRLPAASPGRPPSRTTSRTPLPRQGPAVAARVGAGEQGAVGEPADDLDAARAVEIADRSDRVAAPRQLAAGLVAEALLDNQLVGAGVRVIRILSGDMRGPTR